MSGQQLSKLEVVHRSFSWRWKCPLNALVLPYSDVPSIFVAICFSRERLRRVLRKKLQNYVSSTSSHLHLCTSTFSPISLLIFTSTFTTAHLHLCASSHPHIDISAHLHLHTSTSLLIFTSSHLHLTSLPLIYISHLHLSLFLTFSLKAGGSAAGPPRNATLCGDRACRMREMQARGRFVPVAANPLRRSCASDARNACESAI